MNSKEIFIETGKLGNEINELHKRIDNINARCGQLIEICPHDIVVKYKDDHPRKMPIEGNYFCPACGSTIRCYKKGDISETAFNSSRVINLHNLSLMGSRDLYRAIRNHVFDNFDKYYNPSIPTRELQEDLEEALVSYEIRYENPVKVLKRSTRK